MFQGTVALVVASKLFLTCVSSALFVASLSLLEMDKQRPNWKLVQLRTVECENITTFCNRWNNINGKFNNINEVK